MKENRITELESLHEYMSEVPFDTMLTELYSARSLYGFDPSEAYVPCYALSQDRIVYEHVMRTGLRPSSVPEALSRVSHDFCIQAVMKEFIDNHGQQGLVGIMGGHSLLRDDSVYRDIVLLSKRLTEACKLMVSGGGPGAMEATHLGAWLAGRDEADVDAALRIISVTKDAANEEEWIHSSFELMMKFPRVGDYVSLGIPTWFYGHEPATPFATHIAKLFDNSIREDHILLVSNMGIIFTPGSAGTMQEIFQNATQNHYETYGYSSPMVFFGSEFWTKRMPAYTFLQEMMKCGQYKNLRLSITDSIDEAVKTIMDYGSLSRGKGTD